MGELLDSLNGIDDGGGATGEPASPLIEPAPSIIDEGTETVVGRADAAIRQRSAIEVVTNWVRQAPLQSVAIAFLLGAAFSRRR
jgi:ElaB/YqjD/DUF883 family membrane-anchored ribosome-binding protein